MVEATATPQNKPRDIVSRIVLRFTQMSIAELVPFLDLPDLARFHQLNRACHEITKVGSPKCLRFDILFSRWSPANKPDYHVGWLEEIASLQNPQEGARTADILKKMSSLFKLTQMEGTRYGNTY